MFSLISSIGLISQTTQEPAKIQIIRSNIKNFKYDDCLLDSGLGFCIKALPNYTSWNLPININDNQNSFLIYCGNQPNLEQLESLLYNDNLLLNKCKKARINNYSALGAIFIREDLNKDETIRFLTTLKSFGFKPTDNDKQIINLKIYDTINTNHKTTTNILLTLNNYIPLPVDVKKIIMTHIISLYTKHYY